MKWNDAAKLHDEDEVVVKKNGVTMTVIEVNRYPSLHRVTVMLDDGNWYSHKEIR